jgi:hypothetical protein
MVLWRLTDFGKRPLEQSDTAGSAPVHRTQRSDSPRLGLCLSNV